MLSQIAIMIFGASAIWLVSRKEEWKRWGYIFGLMGQPFWIYESYTNQQWGILIMTLFYAYSWSQGIWNYWIFPKKEKKKVFVEKKKLKRLEQDAFNWRLYMNREQEANLRLINETIPDMMKEFEKKKDA